MKTPTGQICAIRKARYALAALFIQKPDIGPPLSEWCGYEVLRSELKVLGGHDNLLKEIEKEMPQKCQAAPAQQSINEQTPPQTVKSVLSLVNTTTNEQPVEDTSAAVHTGASSAEISNYDLALKHIGLQNWDEALRECETILLSAPNDLRTISLKNVARGCGKAWGAVRNANTRAQSDAGSADLPCKVGAGSLVDILEVKRNRNDVMAVCNVVNEGAEPFEIAIPLCDLVIATGSLSRVSEPLKKLRVHQAQLLAQLDEAKLSLARKRDSMNPYSKEYAATRTAWANFRAKDQELRAKEETAKGDTRTKYIDELEKMKFAQPRIEQTCKTASKKYKDWEDAHPSAPEDLTEISNLEYNLAGVQTQIHQVEQEQ